MSRHLPFLLLLVLAPHATAQSADDKKATLAYLQSHQTKDGPFRANLKAPAPGLRATSSCLRAIKYFGGTVDNLDGCKKFVLACHDTKSGGFADTPGGTPDVVVTAVGLMALVELKIPTDKFEGPAIAFMTGQAKQFEQIRMTAAGLEAIGKASDKNDGWLKDLAAKQNPDGTYGTGPGLVRETGSVVACILRLGGKVKDRDAILQALDNGQGRDGGFAAADKKASELETSYRVLRTYHMLKAKPKRADDLKAFLAKCRNTDGGYAVSPGGESSLSGTYFAGIIYHWLDSK